MSKSSKVRVVVSIGSGTCDGECKRSVLGNLFADRIPVTVTSGVCKGMTIMVSRNQIDKNAQCVASTVNGGAA